MFQEPLLLGNMWLAAAVTYCNAPSLHYVTCHVSGVTRVRVPGPDTDWQLLGSRTGDWAWVWWSCGINNSRQILWLVSVAECWLSPDASNYDDHSLHHALPLTLHITVIKILVSRPHPPAKVLLLRQPPTQLWHVRIHRYRPPVYLLTSLIKKFTQNLG